MQAAPENAGTAGQLAMNTPPVVSPQADRPATRSVMSAAPQPSSAQPTG
jgi:hypothetical protein